MMMQLLMSGGWMMIPIFISSLVALTIVVERLSSLRSVHQAPQVDTMIELMNQGKFTDALAMGERKSTPTLRVLSAGILARTNNPQKAMEAEGLREVANMKRGLPVLDTIITLAPLLGLLGTIIGMIDAFDIMAESGLGQPHAVTGGVAEALICTAGGIFVAVVTLIPYNYFLAKIEHATTLIEEWATKAEAAFEQAMAGENT